jgi:hypothetical protein
MPLARKLSGLSLLLFIVITYSRAQSCTNLCLQQVNCVNGQTTSITGVVYAPNGTDPLPNVIVYIPNAPVQPFTSGVSCPAPNTSPSGSPLVGTVTAVDGSFTLTNVPVGANLPLVIQSGRWRRQLVIPGTVACSNTIATNIRFPRNKSEGDIPKIAIATASSDAVECVLTKVGMDPSEFTDPSANGRINFFPAVGSPGAYIDNVTPTSDSLMGSASTMANYDAIMLPCQGQQDTYDLNAAQRANLVQYVDAGGRLYTSHRGYEWLDYTGSPFLSVAKWAPETDDVFTPDPGIATVNTSFSNGQTLAQWLPEVGASAGPNEVSIAVLRQDTLGVNAPTQSYLTLNAPAQGNPVMQFTFDTPVGQTTGQCGRVLYNDYHVEDEAANLTNLQWPTECSLTDTTTAQEKLLEYSLFDLTSDGAPATLAPASQDLGSAPVGFPAAVQHFTWTNAAVFGSYVSSVSATGDFSATTIGNCNSVAAGATCDIAVTFTPTALGVRTGVLTVNSPGLTLTSALTGTGTPDLALSSAPTFPLTDINSTTTQALTLTNLAPGTIPLLPPATSGNFSATSACAASIGANASCTITVGFTPTSTGPGSGALTVTPSSLPFTSATRTLNATGVDFSISVSPTSGHVVAGDGTVIAATTSPIAGFSNTLTLSCTTDAPASTCTPVVSTYSGASTATTNISITTVSKYAVIGYTGIGSRGIFLFLTIASTLVLFIRRNKSKALIRCTLAVFLLAAAASAFTGCSGHLPAEHPVYTPPGNYTYTVSATDGILTHTATYALNVTAK